MIARNRGDRFRIGGAIPLAILVMLFDAWLMLFVQDSAFGNNFAHPKAVIGLLLIILALQVLLFDSRLRSFWLDTELLAFCLFVGVLLLATISPPPNPQKAEANGMNSLFILPGGKIQSDLTTVHDGGYALLLLLTPQQIQRYTVQIDRIQGISSDDHDPPYNTDAVKVHISLLPGTHATTIASFALQLTNSNVIYLFPLASASADTASLQPGTDLVVILHDKIASDLSILQSNQEVLVLLIVDGQTYSYPVTLGEVRDKDGNLLHPPYVNERAASVSVKLKQ